MDKAGMMGAYDPIIADLMEFRRARHGKPMVVGICGSQGSGKSTMARLLQSALCENHGLAVAVLSLDDLYLPKRERESLASKRHFLLRTRGVPGTHDVRLGIELLEQLTSEAREVFVTRIPRFDKASDDRRASGSWDEFRGRADVVLFEGWCVCATPEEPAALVDPINDLEREADADGEWRRYVNQQLAGPYRELFARVDRLILIRAPTFDVVYEWRRQQERELEASLMGSALPADGVMNDEQLARFVMFYERVTRHILAEMPGRADLVVSLDSQRQVLGITRSSAAGAGSPPPGSTV